MSADTLLDNKKLVWEFQKKLSATNAMGLSAIVNEYIHEDVIWHGPHPINELRGVGVLIQKFWKPFIEAFPDFERHNDILLGGSFKGGEWVSSMGHYVATFTKNWLDIPANGQLLTIRFGEFCRIQDGKIIEMYVLLDMLDVMRQVGLWPLKKSLGVEGWWPKPSTNNGIVVEQKDLAESRKTNKLLASWKDEVNHFNSAVVNMDLLRHAEYFHPKCLRYGPSGIGANRGIEGFKKYYQRPVFNAFTQRKHGNHQTYFAEGRFLAASGWEGMKGVHSGEYLGVYATGNVIKVRVMEWWRRSGNLIKESWILIDMADLLMQMGVDVFAKMHDVQHQDQWL